MEIYVGKVKIDEKTMSDFQEIWDTIGIEKYNRYQCQKQKLKNIFLKCFDDNLTETENMIFNGFHKIYDCGNLVFIYLKS